MAADGPDTDRVQNELDSAFRAHRDWLVRRLALIVGDAEEARDLAQETFVRAAEHWPLPDPTEPARWLSTVGVRLAIDERRRRRRWGFFDLSVDGPLPQAILLRDDTLLTGPWPMSFGPAPLATCGAAP